MRRKPLLLGLGVFLLLVSAVVAALAFLVTHERAFYKEADVPPGPERSAASRKFVSDKIALGAIIRNQPEWSAEFSDRQINSFLAEDFINTGMAEVMLPEGIREPRVSIEEGRVRLGFRYGTGRWSTVVSVDFNVWLANKEPNQLVLEILGLHAGALPISAQTVMEWVSDFARRNSLEVNWYRKDGHPVALLKLQPDQPRPTVQLKQIVLQQGLLSLSGGYVASSTRGAAVAPLSLRPAGH